MEATEIKHFVEAALLAAGRPLSIDQLQGLFDGRTAPEKSEIREAIATLNDEYEERGIVVTEVASGFRMQVKAAMEEAERTGSGVISLGTKMVDPPVVKQAFRVVELAVAAGVLAADWEEQADDH